MKSIFLTFLLLIILVLIPTVLLSVVVTSPVWGSYMVVSRVCEMKEYNRHGYKKDLIDKGQEGGGNFLKTIFNVYEQFNSNKEVG